MPANNELSDLEQGVLHYVQAYGPVTAHELVTAYTFDTPWNSGEVNQAISDLVQKNYITGSAEMPLRYSVVEGI